MNDMASEMREEPTIPDMQVGSGGAGFLAGVVVGAFLGAGIALLFAPERGTRTRRRLGRRVQRLRSDAQERAGHVSERTRRELRRRARRLRAEL